MIPTSPKSLADLPKNCATEAWIRRASYRDPIEVELLLAGRWDETYTFTTKGYRDLAKVLHKFTVIHFEHTSGETIEVFSDDGYLTRILWLDADRANCRVADHHHFSTALSTAFKSFISNV